MLFSTCYHYHFDSIIMINNNLYTVAIIIFIIVLQLAVV